MKKQNGGRGAICQLTTGHSLDDERVLHRMALSCTKFGFESAVAGPAESNEKFEDIPLIAVYRRPGGWLRGRHIGWLWLTIWALRSKFRVFQFHDPDLILAGLVLRLFGRKVIYDVHDDYQASFQSKFARLPILGTIIPKVWWFFEKQASRFFNEVIVADKHLSEKFCRCEPTIIGNYPPLDFTDAADLNRQSTFNLLYVGGVSEQRGVRNCLQAFQNLDFQDIRLHIVGNCRDLKLKEDLESDPRVVLHGFVNWRDLHKHYENSHVGLAIYQPLPGFVTVDHSVKIVEYMAAGLPIITSNFPGLKKFVAEQGAGFVIDPTKTSALSEKIKLLYQQPKIRDQLGKQGRSLFVTKYHWESYEPRLKEVLIRVTQNS